MGTTSFWTVVGGGITSEPPDDGKEVSNVFFVRDSQRSGRIILQTEDDIIELKIKLEREEDGD